jgi:capsular exopolysaccharide synthesis family protein
MEIKKTDMTDLIKIQPHIEEKSDQIEIIDIRHYFAVVWHWAWLVGLITLVAGLLTFIISKQITPVYAATTTVLVNEAPSNSKTSDYNSILTSERLTQTYSQIMVKQPILSEIIQQLNLDIDITDLEENISVQPVRDTQLINIIVKDHDPLQATLIANTLVTVFTEQIQSMQTARFSSSKQNLQDQLVSIEHQITETNIALNKSSDPATKNQLQVKSDQLQQLYSNLMLSFETVQLSEAESTSTVVSVEPANVPEEAESPKILLNILIVSLAAFILSIGGVFASEALDDTLKTADDVNNLFGLSVLGIISHHSLDVEGKPITEAEPRSPVSEAFRNIRTNVQYTGVDRHIQTLLVTSPLPGEGKTTVITNLAIVLAQSGLKTTVIDGDMRRPSLHKNLGARNHLGLTSIFVRAGISLDGIIQESRVKNLSLITAGRIPPNPSELLGSQKMHHLIDRLKEEAEIVLIDTPPVLAVTDATVLSPFVDGVIIVMRPGETKLAAARQAVDQLRRVGANLIGVVLNDVNIKRTKYGYYYDKGYQIYGSEYYYSDGNGNGNGTGTGKSQTKKLTKIITR